MIGLCVLFNASISRFSYLWIFLLSWTVLSLESWAWFYLLSREKNGTRPYNLNKKRNKKKTQWRYLAIMATVDPIGIDFSANGTDCSCDYRAFPINHGHTRDRSILGITWPYVLHPIGSLLASTRYELEDWAHKHLSDDSIINRLKQWNISNICPNCFLPSYLRLDLDLTDWTFFRGQTISIPRFSFSITYKTIVLKKTCELRGIRNLIVSSVCIYVFY